MRKKFKERIKNQLRVFSHSSDSSFSPGFSDRVMEKIDEIEKRERMMLDFYGSLQTVFKRVALIGAIILLVLLSYNIKIGDNFSEEEAAFASDAVYNELHNLPLF
jgi:hypothetical protein